MILFNNKEEQNEINFTKMHGLGNDYLIINCMDNKNSKNDIGRIEENKDDISKIARYLCNRNFGVGADGIILVSKSNIADFKMNIYNSDGSEAEMCGNGIRCFAKYVYEENLTGKQEIKIETLAGIKDAYIRKSKINSEIMEITINMGRAILEIDKIPVIQILKKDEIEDSKNILELETKNEIVKEGKNELVKIQLKVLEKELEAYCISMGNPHTVIFCEDVEKVPIKSFGSLIEEDEHFPEKTNVEFIQVLGSSSIKMRVWERGVGETYACGSGACASVAVCNKLGITKEKVAVYLKGGELKIEIDEETQEIYMTGITTKVFDGKIKI